MIASFAAAQDWDGIWLFTYSHAADNWARETMSGFFDIDTNPAKWGFMRACTAIFRDRGHAASGNSQRPYESQRCPAELATLAEFHAKHGTNMLSVLAGGTWHHLRGYAPRPGSSQAMTDTDVRHDLPARNPPEIIWDRGRRRCKGSIRSSADGRRSMPATRAGSRGRRREPSDSPAPEFVALDHDSSGHRHTNSS